jgi:hypothetical protein
MNGTVGCDFQKKLLIVGLLVNTEILYRVLHILDRRINRVDCNDVDIIDTLGILISRNPAASLVDRKLDVE